MSAAVGTGAVEVLEGEEVGTTVAGSVAAVHTVAEMAAVAETRPLSNQLASRRAEAPPSSRLHHHHRHK